MANIRFPAIPPRIKTIMWTIGSYLGIFFNLLFTILLSPLTLLNDAIAKLAIAIIKHKKFNIFNLKLRTLKKMMSVVVAIESAIMWFATMALISFIAAFAIFIPIINLGVNIVVVSIISTLYSGLFGFFASDPLFKFIYNIMAKPLQTIDAEIATSAEEDFPEEPQVIQIILITQRQDRFASQIEPEPEMIPEFNEALDAAINNLEIDALLNLLNTYTGYSPWDRYCWNDILERKFQDLRLDKIGVWRDLEPSILEYLANKYEHSDLYCYSNLVLKRIPVIVKAGRLEKKDDLLTILKLLYDKSGVIREWGDFEIPYTDIRFDSDTAALLKSVKAKALDMQTELFNSKFAAATATNNFKDLLEHLQQLETKHDLTLGALYWNNKLQQALSNFDKTALDGKYPRAHCCNITLKVMQNPCYIIDPADPSKRIYYEQSQLLRWISEHDSLPVEQSEAAPVASNNTPAQRAPLLSQIHYDDALKKTLDATYNYKLRYNKALTFMATTLNPAPYFYGAVDGARKAAKQARKSAYARLI